MLCEGGRGMEGRFHFAVLCWDRSWSLKVNFETGLREMHEKLGFCHIFKKAWVRFHLADRGSYI